MNAGHPDSVADAVDYFIVLYIHTYLDFLVISRFKFDQN